MMIRQKAMRAALCEFSLKSQTVFFLIIAHSISELKIILLLFLFFILLN